MIIGLTGRNASGKGSVADILKQLGYTYDSLSDVIREEIRASGGEVSRRTLIETGNRLRGEFGAGVLAERILQRIDAQLRDSKRQGFVVDSFRNPQEVVLFRRRPEFILLCVEARDAVRFERLRTRGREEDPKTLEEFRRLEVAEDSSSPVAQQLAETGALADRRIANDDTLDGLAARLEALVRQLADRAGGQRDPG